jgi:hypothetical protein
MGPLREEAAIPQVYIRLSQAGHGLNEPQEQRPLVIKLGDLK